jgi:hypothetical protein
MSEREDYIERWRYCDPVYFASHGPSENYTLYHHDSGKKYFEQYDIPVCRDKRCTFCHSILEAYFLLKVDRMNTDVHDTLFIRGALDSMYSSIVQLWRRYVCEPTTVPKIDKGILNVFREVFSRDMKLFDGKGRGKISMFLYLNPIIVQRITIDNNTLSRLRNITDSKGVDSFIRSYTDGIDILSPNFEREIGSVNLLRVITGRDMVQKISSLFSPLQESDTDPSYIDQKSTWKMDDIHSLIITGLKEKIDRLQIGMPHLIENERDYNEGRQTVCRYSRGIQASIKTYEMFTIGVYIDALYEVTDDKENFVVTMLDTLYERFMDRFRYEIDVIERWKKLEEIIA